MRHIKNKNDLKNIINSHKLFGDGISNICVKL